MKNTVRKKWFLNLQHTYQSKGVYNQEHLFCEKKNQFFFVSLVYLVVEWNQWKPSCCKEAIQCRKVNFEHFCDHTLLFEKS